MTDVYIVGVGGQGIITASKIIGDAALLAGEEVVLSETHGMAQRGGSVVCTARIGRRAGALIDDRRADVILSLELLETLRALCKASKATAVVSSKERIVPLSVSSQKSRYPTEQEVAERVLREAKSLLLVDAAGTAAGSGVPMSSNIVMVGALAGTGLTGLGRTHFEAAIGQNIQRNLAENMRAFSEGYRLAGERAL
ncbi:MAG: indolepyruvate oxidoreductase subunit beta [Candidatus Thermoplasmatota archaeon]